MKKIYSTPRIDIVQVEVRDAMLQMSINNKELEGGYGWTKEYNNEWANIWNK